LFNCDFRIYHFIVNSGFPKGIWFSGEENTKIKTYQKEGAWFGKIVSSDNPKAITVKDH